MSQCSLCWKIFSPLLSLWIWSIILVIKYQYSQVIKKKEGSAYDFEYWESWWLESRGLISILLHVSWNDQRNIKIDTNLHQLKDQRRVIIYILRNSNVFLLDLVQMKWQGTKAGSKFPSGESRVRSNQRMHWQTPDTFLIGSINVRSKANLWSKWGV